MVNNKAWELPVQGLDYINYQHLRYIRRREHQTEMLCVYSVLRSPGIAAVVITHHHTV